MSREVAAFTAVIEKSVVLTSFAEIKSGLGKNHRELRCSTGSEFLSL